MKGPEFLIVFIICCALLEVSSKIMLELEKNNQADTYEYLVLTAFASLGLAGALYGLLSAHKIAEKQLDNVTVVSYNVT